MHGGTRVLPLGVVATPEVGGAEFWSRLVMTSERTGGSGWFHCDGPGTATAPCFENPTPIL